MTPTAGRPRIAIIYGDYPPNPPGRSDGGSDFLQRLAEGLVARGHDVTAIVSKRDDRVAPFNVAGVEVVPIITDWSVRGALGGQLSMVRRVLDERQVDVVHLIYPDPFLRYGSNSYHLPFLLKPAVSRPLVVTLFGFGVKGAGLIGNAGLLGLFATADRMVITDADLLRRFRRTLPWWARKSGGGLVGGIAPDKSPTWSLDSLQQRKSALGLDPHGRHIGFFGFWSPDKGLENLLEAHRLLREGGRRATLLLIGGRAPGMRFAYEQGIIALAERLEIADSLIETGPISPEEVTRHMVAMDLCVLPFKVNPLGRSSLALALGLGVPTLVTRPLGAEGSLLEGSPSLESLEPADIARSIGRLLDDPHALEAAATSGLRAGRHWSWDVIVSEYSAMYDQVLRDHEPAAHTKEGRSR